MKGTSLASSIGLPVRGSDALVSFLLKLTSSRLCLSPRAAVCFLNENSHTCVTLLHLHPHHPASCSFPSLHAPFLAGSQTQGFLWPVGVVCHIRQLRGEPRGPAAEANVRRTGSARDAGMAKQLTVWPWASHLTSACLS